MRNILTTLAVLLPLAVSASEYQQPVQLTVNDEPVSVPIPGYASPFLHDLDGDGKKDLLVGQYRKGRIMVYPGLGSAKFSTGKPLEAGGETVKIPGIW